MASRKRPRMSDISREMAQSNQTMTAFLGGAQKDWMFGGRNEMTQAPAQDNQRSIPPGETISQRHNLAQASRPSAPATSSPRPAQIDQQSTLPIGTYPQRRNPAQVLFPSAPAASVPETVQDAQKSNNRQKVIRNVPRALTIDPSGQHSRAGTSPSVLTGRTGANVVTTVHYPYQHDPVLPSPAPSDDARSITSAVLFEQNLDGMLPSGNSSIAVSTSILTEPTVGFEALENSDTETRGLLEDIDGMVWIPHEDQTHVFESGPQNSTRAVTSSSDVGIQSQCPTPPILLPTGINTTSINATSSTNPQDTLNSSNSSREDQRKSWLSFLLSSVEARTEVVVAQRALGNGHPTEERRLQLLADACKTGDALFLTLHQMAFWDSIPQHLVFSPNHIEGLQTLRFLIMSIVPSAALSEDASQWFAKFPGSLSVMSPFSTVHELTCREAQQCIELLGRNWTQFKDHCIARKSPPLADYMEVELGMRSKPIQLAIYTTIYRIFWIGQLDSCFDVSTNLFLSSQSKSQTWSNKRKAGFPPTKEEMMVFYKGLIAEHQRLSIYHLQHANVPQHHNSTSPLLSLSGPPQPSTGPQPHWNYSGIAPSNTNPRQHTVQANMPGRNHHNPLYRTRNTQVDYQEQPGRRGSLPLTPVFSPVGQSFSNLQSDPTLGLGSIVPGNQASYQTQGPPVRTLSLSSIERSSGVVQRNQPQSSFPIPNTIVPSNAHGHLQPPGIYAPPHPHDNHQVSNSRRRRIAQSFTLSTQNYPMASPNSNLNIPAPSSARQLMGSNYSTRNIQSIPLRAIGPSEQTQSQSQAFNGLQQSNRTVVNSSIHNLNLPFLPPQGYVMSQISDPNLENAALHQAHVRDAYFVTEDLSSDQITKHFLYCVGFETLPFSINPSTRHVHSTFHISTQAFSAIPKCLAGEPGGPVIRLATAGSRTYRVRCIKSGKGDEVPESQWVVAETFWPSSLSVLLNGLPVELRRKSHYGKDMPTDITTLIKEGRNEIRAALLWQGPISSMEPSYYIAVEIVEFNQLENVKQMVGHIKAAKVQEQIRSQLNKQNDEIEVLNSGIVIGIVDPFSSCLINTPVRGKTCVHYECFDLNNFLQTRPGSPCKPEAFLCPICGADARPQSLLLDEWFAQITKAIRDAKREDAKAILVDDDLRWRIKEVETQSEKGDCTGQRPVLTRRCTDTGSGFKPGEIIELD